MLCGAVESCSRCAVIQCEGDDNRVAVLSSSVTKMMKMMLDWDWCNGYPFRTQLDSLPDMPDLCQNAWGRKDGAES